MDESAKRIWDVRLGLAAPMLAVVGILAGVWQFNEGARNQREAEREARVSQSSEEFQRRLWLDKVQSYRQIAELTGQIVASSNVRARTKAIHDFTAAYWGMMILVGEDSKVESAMIAFNNEVRDLQTGWSTDADRLKVRANELMLACKHSIEADRPQASIKHGGAGK